MRASSHGNSLQMSQSQVVLQRDVQMRDVDDSGILPQVRKAEPLSDEASRTSHPPQNPATNIVDSDQLGVVVQGNESESKVREDGIEEASVAPASQNAIEEQKQTSNDQSPSKDDNPDGTDVAGKDGISDQVSSPQAPPRAQEERKNVKLNVPRIPCSLWGANNSNKFEFETKVGQGTFGSVFKAKLKSEACDPNAKTYALKRLNMKSEKEGYPITALREVGILKGLKHKNIVELHEVVVANPSNSAVESGQVFLVFDYMKHDLHGMIDGGVKFSIPQVKCLMKQLLEGVKYLHENNVMHRDIKGANLLLNDEGVLKLTDFGLARKLNPTLKNYTTRVVTLWYRAPELLLNCAKYGTSVDMWSIGCVFSELLTSEPLFPGNNEEKELDLIFQKCGWADEELFPHIKTMKSLPDYKHSARADSHAVDLIEKMLSLDPSKRITAAEALNHPYFSCNPLPCDPSGLPVSEKDLHEFTVRKERSSKKFDKAKVAQEQEQAAPYKLTNAEVLKSIGHIFAPKTIGGSLKVPVINATNDENKEIKVFCKQDEDNEKDSKIFQKPPAIKLINYYHDQPSAGLLSLVPDGDTQLRSTTVNHDHLAKERKLTYVDDKKGLIEQFRQNQCSKRKRELKEDGKASNRFKPKPE